MTETSDKILNTIAQQKICPAPRWRFLAANWALWVSFAFVMGLGALSISLILDLLIGHDWDLYPYLHKSFAQYLFFSIPYLWIISLAVFSIIAYINFTHLKGWYRHRAYKVITAGMLLSMIFGIICFYFGIGSFVDDVLAHNVPYYKILNGSTKLEVWNHPREGLLGGEVSQIDNPTEFQLIDENGDVWKVVHQERKNDIEEGERVKVIGHEEDERTFIAREIRDWEPHEIKRPPLRRQNGAPSGICTKPQVPCH